MTPSTALLRAATCWSSSTAPGPPPPPTQMSGLAALGLKSSRYTNLGQGGEEHCCPHWHHTHLYCCERKVTMEAGVTW